jgi:hypothetical protein
VLVRLPRICEWEDGSNDRPDRAPVDQAGYLCELSPARFDNKERGSGALIVLP